MLSKAYVANCGRNLLRSRQLSSKIPSDEKLLNDILSQDAESDFDNVDANISGTYRRNSNLEQHQTKKRSTMKDPNYVPPIGPKYWRNQFRKSYQKVEEGLTSSLEDYVKKNMDVIESYNKKHRKTVEERIKVDYNKELKWKDAIPNYNLRVAIARYLSNDDTKSNDSLKLTPFQKRYFALMSGYASTIAKGPCGSGKSFSLLLSALSLRRSRTRGKGINTLIIVKSNALVYQYQQQVLKILRFMPGNKKFNSNSIAQFLYRGTPDEELQQEDDLTDFQCPHMLVTTPQRMLDILSSRGMDFLKLNSLSFIGVDDFSFMLDETLLLETPKKAPVVKLLDYVLKLQDYRRSHNDPHPQVVLVTDDSATENIVNQVKEYTKWIDWKKFAPIGRFGEQEDIPHYKYVSSKAAVSSVMVLPRFVEDAKSGKFKVSLFDMKQFEYGKTPSNWLSTLYRSSFGNSMIYKKHRNTKWSSVPLDVKKGELEIICAGLGKLLKKKGLTSWLPEEKQALVIHADELNSNMVVDVLSKKTNVKVEVLDIKNHINIFNHNIDQKKDPKLFVVNSSALLGLTLKSLNTIFVLGLEAIKTEHTLSMIMGRTRPENGLIPDTEYDFFAQTNRDNKDLPRSRTFILSSMMPDGSYDPFDRNFLERSFVGNGLVKQLPIIGVEERWNEDTEYEYKKAINGAFYDEGESGAIQFGGIYNNSTDEN